LTSAAGTWARTTAIDLLVDKFIASLVATPGSSRRQIISLGAGSDTRFFRLKQKYSGIPKDDLLYHEIDFPTNTATKIRQLESSSFVNLAQELCGVDLLFQNADLGSDCTTAISAGAPGYFIHSRDLRELAKSSKALPWVETNVPTLLISECCLIYLSPTDADAVLKYFTEMFQSTTPLGIVIYEPIRPHDAFGRTMVANLTARGIHLQTLEANATLEMQKQRLKRFGFGAPKREDRDHGEDGVRANTDEGGVGAIDLDYMWSSWVDYKEKDRVTELEWMDEVEEWVLLMKHYCVAWGWRDGSEKGGDSGLVFEGWKGVQSQQDEVEEKSIQRA
jgi:[phosphatase 2A protein]-leucine-carboxy methyltransferase